MITVQEAIESLSVSIVEDTNGIVFVGNFSGGVENTDIIELLTHLSTENEQLKARVEESSQNKLEMGATIYVDDDGIIKSEIVGVDSSETEERNEIVYLCSAKWGQLLLTKKDIFFTKQEALKSLEEDEN